MTPLPIIGITMGDPAGIGPELCLRVLQSQAVLALCRPAIFGSSEILKRVSHSANISFQARSLPVNSWPADNSNEPFVLDCDLPDAQSIVSGQISATCGRAAMHFIEAAVQAALQNKIAAVATAPLHKEALRLANVPYPGHTEIFAALTNTPRVCMMLTSDVLTVSMVTTHIGLAQVPTAISAQRVYDVIALTAAAMQRMKQRTPILAVCGLNPHSGEHGLFGNREEENAIIPAIEKARSNGLQVEGPLPPDAAFLPHQRKKFDAIICQYHDQGHIPFKMLAFDTGVNVTLGLPIIRTSVDHGTAFDIAWKGIANFESMFEAIRAAVRLSAEPK